MNIKDYFNKQSVVAIALAAVLSATGIAVNNADTGQPLNTASAVKADVALESRIEALERENVQLKTLIGQTEEVMTVKQNAAFIELEDRLAQVEQQANHQHSADLPDWLVKKVKHNESSIELIKGGLY